MEINILDQLTVVIYSVFFGTFLGLIYDATSFIGLCFGVKELDEKVKKKIPLNSINNHRLLKKILLGLLDILYFIFVSIMLSIFIFGVNFGIVRWYIIVGNLAGFSIYRLTLGKLISIILSYIALSFIVLKNKFKYLIKKILKRITEKMPKFNKKTISKNKELLFIGTKRQ